MTRPILRVENLRLSVVGNLLFSDLSFEIPPAGIVGIMGPVGTGKSSLLKWVCGTGDPNVYVGESPSADYFYRPLKDGNRPRLLGQKAADSFEETMIMLNALLRSNPPLICLDEITARLSESERSQVIDRVMMISQSRAILFVSHNQVEVESITDSVILLAGGMLQEHTPTDEFFRAPRSDAGSQFIRTGGVALPRIGTPARHLRSDLRGVPDGMRLAGDSGGRRGDVRHLIDDKLCLLDTGADTDATLKVLSDPSAIIDRGIQSVALVGEDKPELAARLSDAGIVVDVLPLSLEGEQEMTDHMQRTARIARRLRENPAVLIADPDRPRMAALAATMQMIYFGLTAERAGELYKEIAGDDEQAIEHEQLLWDLELAIDLARDSTSDLEFETPQGLRFSASDVPRLVTQSDNQLRQPDN